MLATTPLDGESCRRARGTSRPAGLLPQSWHVPAGLPPLTLPQASCPQLQEERTPETAAGCSVPAQKGPTSRATHTLLFPHVKWEPGSHSGQRHRLLFCIASRRKNAEHQMSHERDRTLSHAVARRRALSPILCSWVPAGFHAPQPSPLQLVAGSSGVLLSLSPKGLPSHSGNRAHILNPEHHAQTS